MAWAYRIDPAPDGEDAGDPVPDLADLADLADLYTPAPPAVAWWRLLGGTAVRTRDGSYLMIASGPPIAPLPSEVFEHLLSGMIAEVKADGSYTLRPCHERVLRPELYDA